MKYFLIAGEASGDLHAADVMRALQRKDPEAEFRFIGGDLMCAVGGQLLYHYRRLAYMGIIAVALHLPAILKGLRRCKKEIKDWRPDCVILIDYPGFNMKMAKYVHRQNICPVYYYIAPKIWAWKEYRIKSIRRYVDRLFSILPFEVEFFEQKHHYPISYVGNPSVEEVARFESSYKTTFADFSEQHGLEKDRKIIALLAGSRASEIERNLIKMIRAAHPLLQKTYQLVIACAPAVNPAFYEKVLARLTADERRHLHLVRNETYPLLSYAAAALVTSGTATLETALFNVPQVVCYHTAAGKLVSFMRRLVLKVKYISLVNLICDQEVVNELVADEMTVSNVRQALVDILPEGCKHEALLSGYEQMRLRLGGLGAPQRVAEEVYGRLQPEKIRSKRKHEGFND
ncbi:lipid-A-disaccharide synthase [Alloprevotella tannerae]|uniref:lipid-A-disaccharide synthase n=1 Tax=Alloprevotella tannerae TaxID=76122 RepID=UPI0028E6E158|nr:lipid-A-disaccharide synthase [Alloprevotella tannerae]